MFSCNDPAGLVSGTCPPVVNFITGLFKPVQLEIRCQDGLCYMRVEFRPEAEQTSIKPTARPAGGSWNA